MSCYLKALHTFVSTRPSAVPLLPVSSVPAELTALLTNASPSTVTDSSGKNSESAVATEPGSVVQPSAATAELPVKNASTGMCSDTLNHVSFHNNATFSI
jgi:hypothetical protein